MARFILYDLPQEVKDKIIDLRAGIAANYFLLACHRLHALLSKANFNPSQARVPAGSGRTSGRWAGGTGSPSGEARRLAQVEEEENPRRSLLQETLDPTAEVRAEAFHTTLRSIRRLEPNNPQLGSLTAPNFTPSWRNVNEVNAELEEARKRVADRIANGHAFEEHGLEFGSTSRQQFSSIVRSVVGDSSAEVIDLPRGRTAFYVPRTNVLVIVDTNHRDLGTMYRPSGGKSYIDDLRASK